MKKILLSIVGILGIFGCCFGIDSCINGVFFDYTTNANAGYVGFEFVLSGFNGTLSFNSFVIDSYLGPYQSLNICYGNNLYTSTDFGSLLSNPDYYCQQWDYTVGPGNPKPNTLTLTTPFSVPNGYSYVIFVISASRTSTYGYNNTTNFYNVIDGLFVYPLSRYVVPITSVCYSVITNPKFKVNYGNTFYEYELTDNLEIHLKSPVIMSGSYNYIYDGSTGINLFYNGLSQFYSKDKLYLKSMYWFNNNIFTPICL